jgi:threonine/homoserine/homoserine lactone efflux protein
MLALLLKGLLLGFTIAAIVGPIGILCIRTSLQAGRAAGFSVGLGAATADALYGSVAAYGLAAIATPLIAMRGVIQVIGGIALIYMGLKSFYIPESRIRTPQEKNLMQRYFSSLLLTLANPMTILSFTAVFISLGLKNITFISAPVLVIGIFTGSTLWWFALSFAASHLGKRFSPALVGVINAIASLVIIGFGFVAIATL